MVATPAAAPGTPRPDRLPPPDASAARSTLTSGAHSTLTAGAHSTLTSGAHSTLTWTPVEAPTRLGDAPPRARFAPRSGLMPEPTPAPAPSPRAVSAARLRLPLPCRREAAESAALVADCDLTGPSCLWRWLRPLPAAGVACRPGALVGRASGEAAAPAPTQGPDRWRFNSFTLPRTDTPHALHDATSSPVTWYCRYTSRLARP